MTFITPLLSRALLSELYLCFTEEPNFSRESASLKKPPVIFAAAPASRTARRSEIHNQIRILFQIAGLIKIFKIIRLDLVFVRFVKRNVFGVFARIKAVQIQFNGIFPVAARFGEFNRRFRKAVGDDSHFYLDGGVGIGTADFSADIFQINHRTAVDIAVQIFVKINGDISRSECVVGTFSASPVRFKSCGFS